MKVLVISCHPDDEVLGVGGTILQHRAVGDDVHVAMVTDGCSGVYDASKKALLADSLKRCANHLGVTRIHELDLPNQRLDTLPLIEIAQHLERVIAAVHPDVVYLHNKDDVNQDHQVVYKAGLIATRPYACENLKAVYLYEVPSSTEAGDASFAPDYFVDITAQLERKIEAFALYETELKPAPHPRSPEAIRALARVRGFRVNVHAAESFVTVWRRA